MEEDQNRAVSAKNRIRKVGFYVCLFLAGFLLAAFAREGIDAMKKTANLAAQTAGEAWAPNSAVKTIARVPLKNGTPAPKVAVAKKNTKVPAFLPAVPAPAPQKEINYPTTAEIKEATSSSGQIAEIVAASDATSAAGNSTPPAPQAPPNNNNIAPAESPTTAPVPAPGGSHLVIAEIQISGTGGTENDFIKFGNPTSANLDISGWKIRKRTKTGTESSIRVIPEGTSVAAGATILWANSKNNFAANMGAQIISSATISKDNSVAVFDSAGNLVDAVSWGGGAGQFTEGQPYPLSPDDGQILKRKIKNGTWQDTGNNSADFLI